MCGEFSIQVAMQRRSESWTVAASISSRYLYAIQRGDSYGKRSIGLAIIVRLIQSLLILERMLQLTHK